jgi:DNA-directed RNA polymerase subunit M/transcription elongation factor TFIIS
MQSSKLFTIDLTTIKGKGDFNCPKCGAKISPDDKTEKKYAILQPLMSGDELESIMLQCKKCDSQIHLTGFRALAMTR